MAKEEKTLGKLIKTKDEVGDLRKIISKQAKKTIEGLKGELLKENMQPLEVFSRMKFDGKIGNNPLKADKPQNLIEQLNQTFTNLVMCKALDYLLDEHKDKTFIAKFGVAKGEDIHSEDEKSVACEIFATVKASNNGKLNKDIKNVANKYEDYKMENGRKKVTKTKKYTNKYVFYHSPDEPLLPMKRKEYELVEVSRNDDFVEMKTNNLKNNDEDVEVKVVWFKSLT